MLLSRPAIFRHRREGDIVIDPFNEDNLGTNSYDVTLGDRFFRTPRYQRFFNPYSEKELREFWGPVKMALSFGEFKEECLRLKILYDCEIGLRHGKLENIFEDDRIILLGPRENILAHTIEFAGGRRCCMAKMFARSSVGRSLLEVCKCAGMGDVGYINRWTMEITNNSDSWLPLKVGMRIAQLAFFEVEFVERNDYSKKGKYQNSESLEFLKENWSPDDMLPKLYLDREIKKRRSRGKSGR